MVMLILYQPMMAESDTASECRDYIVAEFHDDFYNENDSTSRSKHSSCVICPHTHTHNIYIYIYVIIYIYIYI